MDVSHGSRRAENELFSAADTVFSCGERPTVERVHLKIGRSSPARLGCLLDQCWARLSQHLSGEKRLPALPGRYRRLSLRCSSKRFNCLKEWPSSC
ncbi:DNA-binding protein [Pseudomonas syringae]|uniref:DNA-binding protein n=1 Tax=Pseudomonas syringae TaxID=317 RepID=UPI001F480BC8|nr:DNA-binding protein [Pseudomonas syringae]MCH5528073.1 DNA-binding protein [Pseudomonas syringae pv. syringae]MCH5537650.1 DNA-binding protein [Pseudomonas syringae pv. syringae]MCH5542665.1 DNA-binding protein [Pseudomonas syringae pv. syringae]MCH5601475.1 DNA-binding protein [Pseudomonas syringae pv. syringae]MCH5606387.1 DNA-binding protein [Pseudomonas syringae pv. syringae]